MDHCFGSASDLPIFRSNFSRRARMSASDDQSSVIPSSLSSAVSRPSTSPAQAPTFTAFSSPISLLQHALPQIVLFRLRRGLRFLGGRAPACHHPDLTEPRQGPHKGPRLLNVPLHHLPVQQGRRTGIRHRLRRPQHRFPLFCSWHCMYNLRRASVCTRRPPCSTTESSSAAPPPTTTAGTSPLPNPASPSPNGPE